jgi:hypothetical protein
MRTRGACTCGCSGAAAATCSLGVEVRHSSRAHGWGSVRACGLHFALPCVVGDNQFCVSCISIVRDANEGMHSTFLPRVVGLSLTNHIFINFA